MKVYGLDYAETRSACEHCGFLCFDDEVWCPNCHKKKESSFSENADERERQLRDCHDKYEMLRKASKRGQCLFWVFICLMVLIFLSLFIFISAVQVYPINSINDLQTRSAPAGNVLSVMLLWLLSLGQPGLQCSRAKDIRFLPLQSARGILRHIRDGRVAELIYATAILLVVGAMIANWAEGAYAGYYHELNIAVSRELYVCVGVGSLYVLNALWFLWHILSNFLCPYDYQSELNARLQEWRK
jgi:hypothetical protein